VESQKDMHLDLIDILAHQSWTQFLLGCFS